MDELTPRGRALLDKARAAREPSPDDKKRVQARVLAAIASGAAGTAGASGAAAATGGAASSAGAAGAASAAGAGAGAASVGGAAAVGSTAVAGGSGWLAGVVTALTVGGLAAGGVALSLRDSGDEARGTGVETSEVRPPEPQAEGAAAGGLDGRNHGDSPPEAAPVDAFGPAAQGSSTGPGGTGSTERAEADGGRQDGADLEADEPIRRRGASGSGRRSRRGASARPKKPAGPSDLAAEVALLRDADTELQAGDGARALALLRVHAHRYPDSQLWAERDATRILALCALERVEEARRRARDWMARAGDSPLRGAIRSSCAYR